jgi:hypothetical protein
MMFRTCSFEPEVLLGLKEGRWPEACDPELRAHVETCTTCGDLVLVTQTFQRARSESVQQAPGKSPDLIWWRAQIRRRYAAAERVSRPITIAQTFAMLVTLLIAAVLVASQYRHGLHWATRWPGLAPTRLLHPLLSAPPILSASPKPDWNVLLLVPGLGIVALLSGVVVYLASEKS